MKKSFLSFASFIARSLPLPVKQALYRFPPLARFIRGAINASVDEGLSVIEVAAGTLKGYRVLLNLKTEKSRWLGTYEPELQAALKEFLRPDSTVYDVGANIGYITLMMAHHVGPRGRVFAFEALPANVERIQKNVALNNLDNVTIVSAAVIDKSAPVTFYVHESVGMGKAAGSAGRREERYKAEISVPGLSLDDFVYDQGNTAPEVVKMDIEGGELLALPGMMRLLREVRPLLLLELHGPESEKVAWNVLSDCGYTLHAMHIVPTSLRESGYPRIESPDQLGWKAYVIAKK
ncbi:MAG: FkbM family methyltransferase [Anaerolineales bacterium]